MVRTTVDIDAKLLDDARGTLGTRGLTETVDAALADVVRRARLARFDVRTFDVTDEDVDAARRDRLAGDRADDGD